MKITTEKVEEVALLAHLLLTEEEKSLLTSELNAILGYFDMLKQVDTLNIDATSHASIEKNVLREDKVRLSITKEESLQNAPDREGGCFRVPKIIE